METLDPNEERGRLGPSKRQSWAFALVKPGTVKTLLLVLSVVDKIVSLAHKISKIFEN